MRFSTIKDYRLWAAIVLLLSTNLASAESDHQWRSDNKDDPKAKFTFWGHEIGETKKESLIIEHATLSTNTNKNSNDPLAEDYNINGFTTEHYPGGQVVQRSKGGDGFCHPDSPVPYCYFKSRTGLRAAGTLYLYYKSDKLIAMSFEFPWTITERVGKSLVDTYGMPTEFDEDTVFLADGRSTKSDHMIWKTPNGTLEMLERYKTLGSGAIFVNRGDTEPKEKF
jgi:hypothetical protein